MRVLDWPIIVDEVSRDAVAAALQLPSPRVQLIVGAAGLGKSTLATSVVGAVASTDAVVLQVIALKELSGLPLAAMAPALATVGGEPSDDVGHRLQYLFDVVAANPSGHLLMVDDAPLLDDVSASLLNQLIRTTGVRCIMTARAENTLPDPIVRLHSEGLVETTHLRGLSASSASTIAERAFGRRVEPHSLRRLVRVADGNPLFLRELVLGAIERRAVTESALGLEIDQSVLPRLLQEGIESHFESLDPDQRRVVELIAVAEPWPSEMLGEPGAVRALADLGLIRQTPAGEIYLAHPLFGEALLVAMSTEALDERRTDAASRFTADSDNALRFKVAALLAETASPPSAAELAWAARYAHALTDHALAVRLADTSLGQRITFPALLVRAAALSAMNDRRAETALAEAAAAAVTDGEKVLAGMEASVHTAIHLHEPHRAIERELALLQSVSEPSARALLGADIGRWRLMVGEAPLVEPSHIRADPSDSLLALNAVTYEVMFLAQTGQFAQALAAISRARPLAQEARLTFPSAPDLLNLFEFRAVVSEHGLGDGRLFAERHRRDLFSDAVGMWSYALASIALHSGDVSTALGLATQAVEQLRWRDFSGLLDTARALRATAAAQLGQREPVLELLSTVPTGDVKEMLQRAEAEAWLLVESNDRAGAAVRVAEAGALAITMHANALAAPTLYVAVRIGQAASVIDTFQQIAAVAEGEFISAMRAHAQASADLDADALLRVVPRLAAIDLFAGAVDAAAEAAWLFRSAGKRESERKATLMIARWSGGLSGYRNYGFARRAGELTEREWSVAEAAASRQRSKEIATRLGLSVRTVDNHLNNVYRKLGVANRDELRDEIEDMLAADSS
jgi:DNA-binding CsgD family transcriptional regulator